MPLAIAASKEALDDADIDLKQFDEDDFENLGVIVGTGGPGLIFQKNNLQYIFRVRKIKSALMPFPIRW